MATRKRRKTNDDKAVLVGLGVVAAIGAFAWTVHELELHWWMGILFAAAAIAVVVVCVRIETAKQAATAARARVAGGHPRDRRREPEGAGAHRRGAAGARRVLGRGHRPCGR